MLLWLGIFVSLSTGDWYNLLHEAFKISTPAMCNVDHQKGALKAEENYLQSIFSGRKFHAFLE